MFHIPLASPGKVKRKDIFIPPFEGVEQKWKSNFLPLWKILYHLSLVLSLGPLSHDLHVSFQKIALLSELCAFNMNKWQSVNIPVQCLSIPRNSAQCIILFRFWIYIWSNNFGIVSSSLFPWNKQRIQCHIRKEKNSQQVMRKEILPLPLPLSSLLVSLNASIRK